MQKARGHTKKVLPPLEGAWFQGLFHSSARGAFHLSLTVLVHYRSLGGPRRFPQNSSCSAVLRCRLASQTSFRVRASHPLRTNFPDGSATLSATARRRSYNPGRGLKTAPVWANARSLATTCAIIVIFSSSGYLDVSVPRVRPPEILRCGGIAPAGFPHSDIRGSQGICP